MGREHLCLPSADPGDARKLILIGEHYLLPVPVSARSSAWVCGRSLAGTAIPIPPDAWMSVSC